MPPFIALPFTWPNLFKLTCITLLIGSICLVSPSLFASRAISDETVNNLSCSNLNKESLLASLNKDEVFSTLRHLPIANWSFSTGLYTLANCWSLSHGQRILFYLGKKEIPSTEKTTSTTLNMIRRWLPDGKIEKKFSMTAWAPNVFNDLMIGYEQQDNQPDSNQEFFKRNLKEDTEAYQTYRFHQLLKNIEYISKPRERTRNANRKSYVQLMENLNSNRLTETLIRPALKMQHVVLAKRAIIRPTGETDFFVYDSNFPNIENTFYYDPKTEQFYAPEIVGPLKVKNPEKAIGLFLVDEEDREKMLETMVKHYEEICQNSNE